MRQISIDIRNVFDPTVPGEDNWLFRLANTLHIATKPSVIRRELLVYPGDWTDLERIDEAERDLRALPFIKDARILQTPAPDGKTDLLVRTQDSWTTQPQFNVSSEGGQTNYSAGFEEFNLLGYGKDFSYFYKKNADGVGHMVGYNDPQFLNTRMRLTSAFQELPGGDIQDVKLERPFYSLVTRNAGGASFDHSQTIQKVYQNSQLINQYNHESLSTSPYIGTWVNNDPLNVLRLQLNYRYSEDVFRAQDVTVPGTLPATRALSGPIASSSFIQSDFIKETFVEKAGRVEDINLGHQSYAGVGYVSRSFGATENSVPFSVNDSFGFGGNGPYFGLVSYGTSSRYRLDEAPTPGHLFNSIYFFNLAYYQHLLDDFPMTGVIHMESAYVQNPDTDNVLTLGGDTGLRGYKVNSFTGNKSILFNLEDRFFDPQEFLHLAYIGGAAFVDAGQVQPEGVGYDRKNWHADLGLGMRFGLSRSADGTVFRIDLAYAVGPVQQSNRWILSISSSQGFKQTANTYANYPSPTSTQ